MSYVRKRASGSVGSCCRCISYTKHCLFRVKHVNQEVTTDDSNLARCLTTFDLTSLGIGSILGAGIYVVVGQVAMNIAGPSILLSFTIAAFASLLSGLCYAEFGSRVPRTTGSAYAYSYHTVGEFIAFVIGWNLILEYMIGTAADARALSSSVDYLFGRRLQNFSLSTFGTIPHLNTYPDFLAFALTMLVTLILAVGVKESARYTAIFNVFNGVIALLVILLGSFKSDFTNWKTPAVFFPNGAHGVFAGAAACFYAFVGFDIIATTGEEARNASKSIPTAVALSLVVCYVLYMGVSSVLTLMVPFGSLKSSSPLTEAFDRVGFHWAKWVIGSGAICGLSASLMGSEFPLPRIIYAMANDGLLFKFFRRVSERTETPILATVIPGIMTAFFAMLFDLSELVEMMSIGTLLAYSLVCTSILLLRYRPNPRYERLLSDDFSLDAKNSVPMAPLNHTENGTIVQSNEEEDVFIEDNTNDDELSIKPLLQTSQSIDNQSPTGKCSCFYYCCCPGKHPRATGSNYPSSESSNLVLQITVAVWFLSVALSLLLMFAEQQLEHGSPVLLSLAIFIVLALVICCVVVARQPQDLYTTSRLHFKVPLVPFTPMLTIVINVFLMVRLSFVTWIRFGVWMVIGLIIYFGYGIRNSEEAVAPLRSEADGQETTALFEPTKLDSSSEEEKNANLSDVDADNVSQSLLDTSLPTDLTLPKSAPLPTKLTASDPDLDSDLLTPVPHRTSAANHYPHPSSSHSQTNADFFSVPLHNHNA